MRRPGRPQRFSEDFRREAVRLARESERSLTELCAELGVSRATLRKWLRELPPGKPTTAGRVLSLEEQVRQLRKENERLREERDILKKATAFFARESAMRFAFIQAHARIWHVDDDVSGAAGVEGRLLRLACAPVVCSRASGSPADGAHSRDSAAGEAALWQSARPPGASRAGL